VGAEGNVWAKQEIKLKVGRHLHERTTQGRVWGNKEELEFMFGHVALGTWPDRGGGGEDQEDKRTGGVDRGRAVDVLRAKGKLGG